MPLKARRERALALGLCVECVAKPSAPNAKWCRRCTRTKHATRRAYRAQRNAHLRARRAEHRAALIHARALIYAQLHGLPPPPAPVVEPAPATPYYVNRIQPWRRHTPKKRYKYKPRPLPTVAQTC